MTNDNLYNECATTLKSLMRKIVDQIHKLDEIIIQSRVLSERYSVIGADGKKIGTGPTTDIMGNTLYRNFRNIRDRKSVV